MARFQPYGALRTLRGAAVQLPPIRALRVADYERRFAGDLLGAFRGVYGSFDEAYRSAPAGRPTGFDVAGIDQQDILRSRVDRTFSYDYPVLFWLRPLLQPGARVFDYGGHVGVHFYGYRRFLEFPAGLRWVVCEMPSVVASGQVLAEERCVADRLSFTTDVTTATGAHVLLASGVLQYVESPSPAELLRSFEDPPRHLILNKLPLTDGEPYVTLQNGEIHYPAVRVLNRHAFIDSIRAVGYDLVDSWEDHVHRVVIPFHPERTVPWFSGLYFRRAADRSSGSEVHPAVDDL